MTDAKSGSVNKYIQNSLREGRGKEQIETDLQAKGHDEQFVKNIVQETIKLHYAKLRSQGLILILSGAFICFLGCLLVITSSFAESNAHIILYSLTTLGILIILAGLRKVF